MGIPQSNLPRSSSSDSLQVPGATRVAAARAVRSHQAYARHGGEIIVRELNRAEAAVEFVWPGGNCFQHKKPSSRYSAIRRRRPTKKTSGLNWFCPKVQWAVGPRANRLRHLRGRERPHRRFSGENNHGANPSDKR